MGLVGMVLRCYDTGSQIKGGKADYEADFHLKASFDSKINGKRNKKNRRIDLRARKKGAGGPCARLTNSFPQSKVRTTP